MTAAVKSLQNGDVRLNHNDNGNQQEDHGVLEIYLNSRVNTYTSIKLIYYACRCLGSSLC